MSEFRYGGGELELFAHAVNWKRYVACILAPYIGRRVLEVGAGAGANTVYHLGSGVEHWLCLEPDPVLAGRIQTRIAAGELPPSCACRAGCLDDLARTETFDTIVYLDVLEHIEDDRAEMQLAASHLVAGGRLVVLAPAHPGLFSPFDRAIGHFRRYNRSALAAAAPAALYCVRLFYLDAVGLLASLLNRFLLRQSLPTPAQIRMWDGWMVPLSRFVDRLLGFSLGKSVVGIWCK